MNRDLFTPPRRKSETTRGASIAAAGGEGATDHRCVVCGQPGRFGEGVNLRAGRIGTWYCGAHWPCPTKVIG